MSNHSAEFLRGWLNGLREQAMEASVVMSGDLPHVTQISLIERADEILALLAQAEAREAAPDAAAVIAQCREALEIARQQFCSHAGEGQNEELCEQALAAIAAWEVGR